MSCQPIACTLSGADMKRRLVAIGALNAEALRDQRRHGLTLELDYSPHATARVREWVALEQACCAFLTIAVEETPTVTRVRIVAPEAAAEAAEAMFAMFAA